MPPIKKRYLTKSRFKTAFECPTKLYYEGRPEYKNVKKEDVFLEALAEGGFQVGALAQVMHTGGVEIEERSPDAAVAATLPYLGQENFLLFESALKHDNFLIRADILERKGNVVFLKEVKAKSWNSEETFFKKKGGIQSDWLPYLLDVAFQTYIASKVFPNLKINPYLILVNKDAFTSVDGLHQKFRIEKINGQMKVIFPAALTANDVGSNILIEIDATDAVNYLLENGNDGITVPELAEKYVEILVKDERFKPHFGKECKKCEYRANAANLLSSEKSGFDECMMACLGSSYPNSKPLSFDLWFASSDAIENGIRYQEDYDLKDFSEDEPTEGPLERKERQYIQIQVAKGEIPTPWIDKAGLTREIQSWNYPLHFIDFETCMVAIPFHKGHHPYQQIAFQFSHHVMERDGKIRHENEFLMPDRGKFPNYEFLRALKESLSKDSGTIFRYSNHENTVLNQIKEQLLLDIKDNHDADELIKFIESITRKTDKKTKKEVWRGSRCMVDLWELYKDYHYIPSTNGSNSLKYVLPAILNESKFLKDKYSKPIYGSEISSKNYKNQIWARIENGQVLDPYKLLEPMLDDVPQEELENYIDEEGIKNGGAAMMAWAKIQFTETNKTEEDRIRKELLRYCELDTLAMVMLVEHWREETGVNK